MRRRGPEGLAEGRRERSAKEDAPEEDRDGEAHVRFWNRRARKRRGEHEDRRDRDGEQHDRHSEEDGAADPAVSPRDVLRETVPDLAEPPVHPDRDAFLRAEGSHAEAGALQRDREAHVVDDGVPDRSVAADGFVGAPPYEVPGAGTHRQRNAAREREEPEPEEHRNREERHQHVLPEAAVLEAGKEGEEVEAAVPEDRDALPERPFLVAHVRVGKEENFARRRPRAEKERVGLAEPAGRRLDAGDDRQARVFRGEPSEDLRCPVRRPIVDDDHLELGIVLREVRPHGALDAGLLVSRRDYDGDARRRVGRRRSPRDEREARKGGQVNRKDDRPDNGDDRSRDEEDVNHAFVAEVFSLVIPASFLSSSRAFSLAIPSLLACRPQPSHLSSPAFSLLIPSEARDLVLSCGSLRILDPASTEPQIPRRFAPRDDTGGKSLARMTERNRSSDQTVRKINAGALRARSFPAARRPPPTPRPWRRDPRIPNELRGRRPASRLDPRPGTARARACGRSRRRSSRNRGPR